MSADGGRQVEGRFLAGAVLLTGAALGNVLLARDDLPVVLAGALFGGYAAAFFITHFLLVRYAKRGDQLLLPLVALLDGLGLVMLFRLHPQTGLLQLGWTVLGLAIGCGVAMWAGFYQRLARFRYLAGVSGLVLVGITLAFGQTIGGSRAWLTLGPLHFEPSELGKLLVVLFLAGYLDETKDLLRLPGPPKGPLGLRIPNLSYLGPVVLFWSIAMLLLVGQNDLGAALLFFGIFLTMLYVATGRRTYIGVALLIAGAGAALAYHFVAHVRVRVALWLNPWADFAGRGYQIVMSLFALASGGLFGTGLGAGHPELVPAVSTDFILSAFGEEFGLVGLVVIALLFAVLVARGAQIALRAGDEYGLLLGTGLSAILAIQIVTIFGGVVRMLPFTGVTVPFLSYGGTSVVTDFTVVALLGLVSAGGEA